MVACEESLRARGYVPVPIEVGLAILDARGYSLEVPVPSEGPGGAALPAAVDGLGVDACLAIDLRAWDTYWNAGLEAVDYDVRFRLLDAQRGQPLFEREYGASWSWAGRLRTTGSGRPALGDEFEGFTGTGEVPESPYKNAFQFVRQIARRFAASLPARSG